MPNISILLQLIGSVTGTLVGAVLPIMFWRKIYCDNSYDESNEDEDEQEGLMNGESRQARQPIPSSYRIYMRMKRRDRIERASTILLVLSAGIGVVGLIDVIVKMSSH